MKKLFILFLLTGTIGSNYAQNCNPNTHFRALGSSGNIFSMSNNRVNPLSYDSASHSLIFIHRANPTVSGGTSGDLRFDVSSDTGHAWTNNQGILNPTVTATNGGRYPQVVNHNPNGGSNYLNNYLAYYSPTTPGTGWNGYVSGVRKLNNTGNTEHYNQAASVNTLAPGGLSRGNDTTFWTVDAIYDFAATTYSGFRVMKGVWSNNDITWSLNATLTPPFNTAYNGLPQVGDWNIAFDPSGQKGWMVIITHLTGSVYTFRPIFYQTINGGNTWTGPFEVDLNSFPSVTAILPAGTFPTTTFETDLTVDKLGNPHALIHIGSSDGTNYSIYTSNQMAMYDITNDGINWNAHYIYDCYTLRGTVGNAGQNLSHDTEPQVSRSKDGNIIAFVWSDTYGGTGGINDQPNLYGTFYSASANVYSSNLYDYTSCTSESGQIIFPRIAPILISKGNGNYQLPVVYAKLNASGSESDPASYYFIDDLIVNECSITSLIPFITPDNLTSFCQGGSVNLLASTGSSYQWIKNGATIIGATNNSYTVTASGNYSCNITTGCGIQASNTVGVTVNPLPSASTTPAGSVNFCTGTGPTIQANTGTGLTYQWKKGTTAISGATNSGYFANATGNFSVIVTDANGCSKTSASVSVTGPPSNTVSALGPVHFCNGGNVTLKSTSGQPVTYKWKKDGTYISGATNSTYVATATGKYNCVVTNTNGCSKGGTPIDITGPPSAVITANGPVSFCAGGSVVISAKPGYTYQWIRNSTNINGATQQNYTASTAGNYKVTVTDPFACSKTTPNTNQVTVTIPCRESELNNSSENNSTAVRVFPNPVSDNLQLSSDTEEIMEIILYDVTSRKLLQQTFNKTAEIQMSYFSKGVYLYEIKSKGSVINKGKVIKQ